MDKKDSHETSLTESTVDDILQECLDRIYKPNTLDVIDEDLSDAISDDKTTVTEEVEIPTEEVEIPTEEVEIPTEEVAIPTEEVAIPTEEVAIPTEEVAIPTEEVAIPTEEVEVSSDTTVLNHNISNNINRSNDSNDTNSSNDSSSSSDVDRPITISSDTNIPPIEVDLVEMSISDNVREPNDMLVGVLMNKRHCCIIC